MSNGLRLSQGNLSYPALKHILSDSWVRSLQSDGYILGCIAELYGLECEYEQGKLSPELIRDYRQGLKTRGIIGRLRNKLYTMLGEYPPRGELMEKPCVISILFCR